MWGQSDQAGPRRHKGRIPVGVVKKSSLILQIQKDKTPVGYMHIGSTAGPRRGVPLDASLRRKSFWGRIFSLSCWGFRMGHSVGFFGGLVGVGWFGWSWVGVGLVSWLVVNVWS